ncbi:hypothetical protein FRC08_014695 [Ceratobasidium sp. 394]|nr:hypothetical protein FRC08_014695 [Ceratobasidium sp. 394]
MWAVSLTARFITGWTPLIVGLPPVSSSDVRVSSSITNPTRLGIAFLAAVPLPASAPLLVQAGGPNGPPPIKPDVRNLGIPGRSYIRHRTTGYEPVNDSARYTLIGLSALNYCPAEIHSLAYLGTPIGMPVAPPEYG